MSIIYKLKDNTEELDEIKKLLRNVRMQYLTIPAGTSQNIATFLCLSQTNIHDILQRLGRYFASLREHQVEIDRVTQDGIVLLFNQFMA